MMSAANSIFSIDIAD